MEVPLVCDPVQRWSTGPPQDVGGIHPVYSGGNGRCVRRSLPIRRRLSPSFWRVSFRIERVLLEVHSRFGSHVRWAVFAALLPECFSLHRYLRKPLWPLPTGTTVVGWSSHPPEENTGAQKPFFSVLLTVLIVSTIPSSTAFPASNRNDQLAYPSGGGPWYRAITLASASLSRISAASRAASVPAPARNLPRRNSGERSRPSDTKTPPRSSGR